MSEHKHEFAVDASCECGIMLSTLVHVQRAEVSRLCAEVERLTRLLGTMTPTEAYDTICAALEKAEAVVRAAKAMFGAAIPFARGSVIRIEYPILSTNLAIALDKLEQALAAFRGRA